MWQHQQWWKKKIQILDPYRESKKYRKKIEGKVEKVNQKGVPTVSPSYHSPPQPNLFFAYVINTNLLNVKASHKNQLNWTC